jgi:hypothetical protein
MTAWSEPRFRLTLHTIFSCCATVRRPNLVRIDAEFEAAMEAYAPANAGCIRAKIRPSNRFFWIDASDDTAVIQYAAQSVRNLDLTHALRFAFTRRRTDGAGGFFGIERMSKVRTSLVGGVVHSVIVSMITGAAKIANCCQKAGFAWSIRACKSELNN